MTVRQSCCVVFLLCPALLLCAGACAQDDAPVTIQRPFLWEMTPPDSDVKSYLFGTVHVNDPNITKLHPQIDAAFESATAAWFEIDFIKDAAKQTKAITMSDGRKLAELASTATVVRIDARLKKLSPLLSRTSLPEFEVVMWPLILANLEAQMKYLGTVPMDMQLQLAAQKSGKQSGGLEDATSQLKPLLDLPMDQQLEFVEASLDVMDEDDQNGVTQLDILVRLYATGQADELQAYLDKELQRPKVSDELRSVFVDSLLIARNKRMAEAIHEKVMKAPEGVHFVAVGTAHLLGEKSVQDELKALGYKVTRVAAPQDDAAAAE